jgi:hypothetical protein
MHQLRVAAGAWFECDGAALNLDATDPEVVLEANRVLGLFRDNPCSATGEPRTQFLNVRQVNAVLQNWWLATLPVAPPAEPVGPPCARCDGSQHLTAVCPHFSIPRTHSCSDWCRVCSLDQTARAIAEALSLVATGRSPWQRLHIVSNDCYSGQSGAHWFSVVAEMVDGAEAGSGADAAAMDVDHIDRTGGGLALGPAVRAAVDGFLAGVFAGTRRDISVAEMRGRMSNFTARELDAALAALQRDGDIRVEGGVIRLVDD